MFNHEELLEISTLCEQNEAFAKYINKLREENDKLLSKVTHELRNPLTLINSTAQLIESQNPEVRDIKYWGQLRADIESMTELLASFSQYRYCSRLSCTETDLVDLADDVVECFQVLAEEKNISVILEEPEQLDYEMISYICDPVKLRQAMVNLIKNAVEAVEEDGKVWVRIYTEGNASIAEDNRPSYLKIEIANNGRLITNEEMEEIFEFNISSKSENRGLGLAIVQQIVVAHKGKLEVSSEEVDGERKTVFSICLPV